MKTQTNFRKKKLFDNIPKQNKKKTKTGFGSEWLLYVFGVAELESVATFTLLYRRDKVSPQLSKNPLFKL